MVVVRTTIHYLISTIQQLTFSARRYDIVRVCDSLT